MPPSASRDERQTEVRGNDPQHSAAETTADARWREALELWLAWNEAYETTTAQLYQAGGDPQTLEATMDQMDALRRQASELSRRLLGESKR